MDAWPQYNPSGNHTEPTTVTVVIHRYGLMSYGVTYTESATERAHVPGRVPPEASTYTLTGRWATRRGALRGAKRHLASSRSQQVSEHVVVI